jgi:predicted metalloendopeptidase
MTLVELNKQAPGLNWNAFFTAAQLGNIDAVVINQPTYVNAFAKLQAQIPVAQWQQYLKFHLINNDAGNLSKAFVDANFDFYGKTLSSAPAKNARRNWPIPNWVFSSAKNMWINISSQMPRRAWIN